MVQTLFLLAAWKFKTVARGEGEEGKRMRLFFLM